MLHAGMQSSELCDVLNMAASMLVHPHHAPDPQLWQFVLRLVAQGLGVSLAHSSEVAMTADMTTTAAATADQSLDSSSKQADNDVVVAAICALVVISARLLDEETAASVPVCLLSSNADFLFSLTMLSSDAVVKHHAHQLGGMLVMSLASLVQLFDGKLLGLYNAEMQEAILVGEDLHAVHLIMVITIIITHSLLRYMRCKSCLSIVACF